MRFYWLGAELGAHPSCKHHHCITIWVDQVCLCTFCCVKASEVSCSVDDDALHRHVEPEVKTLEAIGFVDLANAVSKTAELPLCWALADVGGQPRPGKVEWVDEAEGGGPSSTARRQVPGKVTPELCPLIHATEEDLLVLVFEGEVQGLGGEVTDHVGQIASPEGQKALLLRDSNNTVHNAFVLHISCDLFAGMLHL